MTLLYSGVRKIMSWELIVLAFLFVSCTKEGPAGPPGPEGPPGPAGATGATGENGATLISSNWIDVNLESGVFASLYYGKIEDDRITRDILDKGLVKMYVSASGSIYEVPNPYFNGLYFEISVGQIELFSPTDWDIASGYRYRFVLIPGE